MRPPLFVCIALVVTTALLSLGAANASSGATQPRFTTASTAAGKVNVKYTVKRFARRGHRLVAYGTAIARYIPGSAGGKAATSRHSFRAGVKIRSARTRGVEAAQTICPILELTIERVDLNLLGLIVHADRIFLTLKGDDQGGLLGRTLCGLSQSGQLTTQTRRLNWAAKKSGLAWSGTGFTVAVEPSTSGGGGGSAGPSAVTPLVICSVLELTLGPVDANLLGLLVHLDQVHLIITADSEGGLLGEAFCNLGGGVATR